MAPRRSSRVLTAAFLGIAVLLLASSLRADAFVPTPALRRAAAPAALAAGILAPSLAVAPAMAGEPPSVGEHWYWNLGFGSLHGETASTGTGTWALAACT